MRVGTSPDDAVIRASWAGPRHRKLANGEQGWQSAGATSSVSTRRKSRQGSRLSSDFNPGSKQRSIAAQFAPGGIALPLLGQPLFAGAGSMPISSDLYGLAQVAAVVLLFLIGLDTDLLQFLRYSYAAALVAVGGNLLSFLFGAVVAVVFG